MDVSAVPFDTHRFVKRLTDAGMDERQAEALADEQVVLLNTNLATRSELAGVEANLKQALAAVEADLKQEIARVEADLRQALAAVEAELKQEIARVEADLRQALAAVEAGLKQEIARVETSLLKWMVGALIAQGGLIVALLRLLP